MPVVNTATSTCHRSFPTWPRDSTSSLTLPLATTPAIRRVGEASIPFLQPLAILHIALAPRHILHLPRVDQPDRHPALLQHFIHGYPEYAGRFEGDRVNSACHQPVRHLVQIVGHR